MADDTPDGTVVVAQAASGPAPQPKLAKKTSAKAVPTPKRRKTTPSPTPTLDFSQAPVHSQMPEPMGDFKPVKNSKSTKVEYTHDQLRALETQARTQIHDLSAEQLEFVKLAVAFAKSEKFASSSYAVQYMKNWMHHLSGAPPT